MAIKTITVTEDAYSRIKSLKHPEESFSQLFLRLSGEKKRVKDIVGILGYSGEKAAEMQARLKKRREEISRDMEARKNAIARQLSAHRSHQQG